MGVTKKDTDWTKNIKAKLNTIIAYNPKFNTGDWVRLRSTARLLKVVSRNTMSGQYTCQSLYLGNFYYRSYHNQFLDITIPTEKELEEWLIATMES